MITVNRRELALELVAAVREDAKLRGELVAALGVQAVPERLVSSGVCTRSSALSVPWITDWICGRVMG